MVHQNRFQSILHGSGWPNNKTTTFDSRHLQNISTYLNDFGTLQCCFVNCILIKFMTQSGATLRKSATRIFFRRLLRDYQHKMRSRTVWRGCWIKATAAVIRWQEDTSRTRSAWTAAKLMLVGDLMCSAAKHGGKSRRRQASVKSDIFLKTFCSNDGHIKQIFKW